MVSKQTLIGEILTTELEQMGIKIDNMNGFMEQVIAEGFLHYDKELLGEHTYKEKVRSRVRNSLKLSLNLLYSELDDELSWYCEKKYHTEKEKDIVQYMVQTRQNLDTLIPKLIRELWTDKYIHLNYDIRKATYENVPNKEVDRVLNIAHTLLQSTTESKNYEHILDGFKKLFIQKLWEEHRGMGYYYNDVNKHLSRLYTGELSYIDYVRYPLSEQLYRKELERTIRITHEESHVIATRLKRGYASIKSIPLTNCKVTIQTGNGLLPSIQLLYKVGGKEGHNYTVHIYTKSIIVIRNNKMHYSTTKHGSVSDYTNTIIHDLLKLGVPLELLEIIKSGVKGMSLV